MWRRFWNDLKTDRYWRAFVVIDFSMFAMLAYFHGPSDFRIRALGLLLQLIGILAVFLDIRDRVRIRLKRIKHNYIDVARAEKDAKYKKLMLETMTLDSAMKIDDLLQPSRMLIFGTFWLAVGIILSTLSPEIYKIVTHDWTELLKSL